MLLQFVLDVLHLWLQFFFVQERREKICTKTLKSYDTQPLGGVSGQAADIEITAREILKLKDELYKIISKHTGQTFKKVNADSDRDYWMKADEAHKYGMVDEVLNK